MTRRDLKDNAHIVLSYLIVGTIAYLLFFY